MVMSKDQVSVKRDVSSDVPMSSSCIPAVASSQDGNDDDDDETGEVAVGMLFTTETIVRNFSRCISSSSTINQLLMHSTVKKGSPYSITERRVPELIPVLGSQPAGDVSHKLGGRLPLLSARPAVTLATLKRAATNFPAW